MSDFGIGDLSNRQDVGEAIEQGVFRAFSEMLSAGQLPRADLYEAVSEGVCLAFKEIIRPDPLGLGESFSDSVLTMIEEGARKAIENTQSD